MSILRRICLFFSLILYSLAIAFVITSLITEYWITVKPLEVNGRGPNSTFVHAGLFYGEKRIDGELEYYRETFSVLSNVLGLLSYLVYLYSKKHNTSGNDYNLYSRAELSFSFYLILAAIGVLFIPMTLMLLSKTRAEIKRTKSLPIDRTVFLY